jgi:hypothetical protein
VFLVLRLSLLIWFLGAVGLGFATLADTVFGTSPFNERLQNLLPRLAVVAVWPLAAVTPRGRYLLWARWKVPPR